MGHTMRTMMHNVTKVELSRTRYPGLESPSLGIKDPDTCWIDFRLTQADGGSVEFCCCLNRDCLDPEALPREDGQKWVTIFDHASREECRAEEEDPQPGLPFAEEVEPEGGAPW